MGCEFSLWQQLREADRKLGAMRKVGIPDYLPVYQEARRIRDELLAKTLPDIPYIQQLARFIGLSPGVLALWHHGEAGWFVEARVTPGAPPVYHAVSEEIAEDILAGRYLHNYMDRFAAPAADIDN